MAEIVRNGTPGEDNIQDGHWRNEDHVTSSMGDSNDYFAGWGASYDVDGEGGNDHIVAGNMGGTGHGSAGDDWLDSMAHIDGTVHNLFGDEGNDFIFAYGFSADSTVNASGGAGVDAFQDNHNGTDVFDGGADFDWFTQGGSSALTISLMGGSSGANLAGNSFSNIEGVSGGSAGDTLIGDNQNNVLAGADGADTLIGNGGNDLLVGRAFSFEEFTGTRNHFNASHTYSYTESSTLWPDSGLNDDGAADNLSGGIGNDVLMGGYGSDVLNGGPGRDTASYADSYQGVTVNLETGTATDGTATGDTFTDIEDLYGSRSNDTLTGNGGVNALFGAAGNDTLDGAGGADSMTGGAGDDSFYVDSASDRTFDESGVDTVFSMVARTLGSDFEHLTLIGANPIGGNGNASANQIAGNNANNLLQGFGANDTLTGNGGADRLDGGAGDDSMAGGAANDLYYVDSAGDVTAETAGEGTDTVYTSVSWTLSAETEILRTLNNAAIAATGNGAANTMIDGSGASRLSGLGANDQLSGYGGSDTLEGGEGEDILNGGDGADTIDGGAGNDRLRGGAGGDSFLFQSANAGIDTVYDFSQAAGDRFALSGGSFTARSEANGNTVLTHTGGKIVVVGVTGLSLAQWNGLAGAPAQPESAHPEAARAFDASAPDAAPRLADASQSPATAHGSFDHHPLVPLDYVAF